MIGRNSTPKLQQDSFLLAKGQAGTEISSHVLPLNALGIPIYLLGFDGGYPIPYFMRPSSDHRVRATASATVSCHACECCELLAICCTNFQMAHGNWRTYERSKIELIMSHQEPVQVYPIS